METTKPSFGPLDDVKVLYSAVEIAAPTAAEIMSEWGADVTWVENTWTGDSCGTPRGRKRWRGATSARSP